MSQIKCPFCGHLLSNKIDFASHIKRCKESDSTKFNRPKNNSKRKRWTRDGKNDS